MTNTEQRMVVFQLPGTNTLIIKKESGSAIFRTTEDSIFLSKDVFIGLLNFMLRTEIIHPAIVAGILEEINTN